MLWYRDEFSRSHGFDPAMTMAFIGLCLVWISIGDAVHVTLICSASRNPLLFSFCRCDAALPGLCWQQNRTVIVANESFAQSRSAWTTAGFADCWLYSAWYAIGLPDKFRWYIGLVCNSILPSKGCTKTERKDHDFGTLAKHWLSQTSIRWGIIRSAPKLLRPLLS